MPRILLCCAATVAPEIGTAKVYIEVAAGLRRLGWDAVLAGPEEMAPGEWFATSPEGRCTLLRQYLSSRAAEFDVIDFDHCQLPFPRAEFPPHTLLVARSVLLSHLVLKSPIPCRRGLRHWLGHVFLARSRQRQLRQWSALATRTCTEADLVNLCNDDEAAELRAHGIPSAKMVVLPFGLTTSQRADLEAIEVAVPACPTVAFVGTFDPRKGMRDFPALVSQVSATIPGVRFKLLGTAGMLQTAEEVYAEFPRRLWPTIEVVPKFAQYDLRRLLSDCSVGVFPSAVEGFPFGVLEMLAAALPVVAYRVPGPPMMLPDEDLVSRGNVAAMATRVAALLRDPEKLLAARRKARTRSGDFDWDRIAAQTAVIYESRLACLRGTAVTSRAEVPEKTRIA